MGGFAEQAAPEKSRGPRRSAAVLIDRGYERGRGASSGIQSWKLRFARSAAGWFRVTRGSGHVPIWLGWDSGNLLGLCPPLPSLPDGNEPRISELGNLTSGWGGRVLSFISIPSFYTGAAVNASRVELPLVGLVSRARVSVVRGTTLLLVSH